MTSEIARHTDWHRLKTQTIGAFHIFPLCHIDLRPQVAASFKAMKRHNEIRKIAKTNTALVRGNYQSKSVGFTRFCEGEVGIG